MIWLEIKIRWFAFLDRVLGPWCPNCESRLETERTPDGFYCTWCETRWGVL